MNAVIAHKDAYLFAKPVTERDAPGYESLIFQAQDLKSIKAAISAGGRAVAVMVEESGEEIGSGVKSVWVPESEDVKPPKGIVNPAQLEKELMRVFANAVMFNPDVDENRGLGPAFRTRARTIQEHESGTTDSDSQSGVDEIGVAKPLAGAVVMDTRGMCHDVVEALDGWRGIGRTDDAEARGAPVIIQHGDNAEATDAEDGKHVQEQEEEMDELADEEGEAVQEQSEEPRSKRRRRL